jgi:hypothetical protein
MGVRRIVRVFRNPAVILVVPDHAVVIVVMAVAVIVVMFMFVAAPAAMFFLGMLFVHECLLFVCHGAAPFMKTGGTVF